MHRFIVLGIALFSLLELTIQAEIPSDNLKEQLRSVHVDLESVREDAYGNCYFEGVESVSVDGEERTKSFRFWSRENQYFRIDISNEEDSKVRERLLVRPEGFVKMHEGGNGLAIVNWGDTQTGIDELYSYRFYQASTIGRWLVPEFYFSGFASIEKFQTDSKGLQRTISGQLDSTNGLKVTIESKLTAAKVESLRTLVFDRSNSSVLTRFSQESTVDGSRSMSTETSYEYAHGRNIPIPSLVTELHTDKRGLTSTSTIRATKVDLAAQPLELFYVDKGNDEGGTREAWVRRLILFAVGVVLLGVYFIFRRRANHA